MKIYYSQCWEDTAILKQALAITSTDDVLSITSAGDNSLALLSDYPRSLTMVDKDRAQNFLAELKYRAPARLDYTDYLEFLGAMPATAAKRVAHFQAARSSMSREAQQWWAGHLDLIAKGAIHAGKFERYIGLARRYLLPFVHSRSTILGLFEHVDLASQQKYFSRNWDTWLWRRFIGLTSDRSLLRAFARQPEQDRSEERNHNDDYETRIRDIVSRMVLKNNPYFRYFFTGDFGPKLPDYLSKQNFDVLAEGSPRTTVKFATSGLYEHLRDVPSDSLDKFNLSDIFEAFSEAENALLWEEILRTARPGALVAYWCNQIDRQPPKELAKHFKAERAMEQDLFKRDRVFFYQSFNIKTVLK